VPENKTLKIPTAKEYEAQIGVTPDNRASAVAIFRTMMRKLRSIARRNTKICDLANVTYRPICDTCAFGPNIRRLRGFLATSHGVMVSLTNPEHHFVCHHNQPGHDKNEIETRRLIPCTGFVLTHDEDEAKQAAERARKAITELGIREKRPKPADASAQEVVQPAV